MTDKTENATPENPDYNGPEEGFPDFGSLFGGFTGEPDAPNSKPDTAQGVAELLSQTRDHVEEQAFARIGHIEGGNGTLAGTILRPDGSVEFIDQKVIDRFAERPRFRKGTANLLTLDSLLAHVNRFGDSDTVVFANDDRSNPSLLAVLDYHRVDRLPVEESVGEGSTIQGEFRHGWHRSSFAFPVSDQWKAWTGANKREFAMDGFAAFLEANVLDVADIGAVPASAKRFVEMNGGEKRIADWAALTKLARSLTVFENGVVSQAVNLASGEGHITLSESHETEVEGIKVTVPTMFFIEVPIFHGGAFYRIPVRLRYRSKGGLRFWFELWQHDRAFVDAISEAVDRVRKETVAQVLYGTPEA